jgi:hypothetical protein
MTQPTEWICDTCSEPITDPAMALVTWRNDDKLKDHDFKLVHKGECDPGAKRGYVASLLLEQFLGPDGLAMLLSWLASGPVRGPYPEACRIAPDTLYEFVDLVRRVQTPGYEQARSRFSDPDVQQGLDDANEYLPYLPYMLDRINSGTL